MLWAGRQSETREGPHYDDPQPGHNELHALLLAGFEDASTLLGGSGGPDIDELRRREIEINATEAAFREFLQAQIDDSTTRTSPRSCCAWRSSPTATRPSEISSTASGSG